MTGENHNSKRYMHPSVDCSAIYNTQEIEAISMSTDRWVDKEDVVHTQNGILLTHEKEWYCVICRDMDGPSLSYRVKYVRKRKTNIIY